nr:SCP2 sterol-binding domain-containing protein [uncultured Niameybacter sp.]
MKILLLLANCIEPTLQKSKEIISNVLRELEVEVKTVELEHIPYYQGVKSEGFGKIARMMEESDGIVAISGVHIAGMHSAMQNFFEHMTQWEESVGSKPLFALTYSDFMGEKQAANKIIEIWGILGGTDGGNMALNSSTIIDEVKGSLEKNVETFYRIIRQGRTYIMSSERQAYLLMKQQHNTKSERIPGKTIKTLTEILGTETKYEDKIENRIENKVESRIESKPGVDLSTKEQNIQELTQLLKSQMKKSDEEFVHMSQVTYSHPRNHIQPQGGKARLHHIPHYFIGQHNREMNMVIQYLVTDVNENGAIVIKDGDCNYIEGIVESPTIEITTTSEILTQVLTKQITYQKAFMIGKLKVRGNFAILSKLDQVFKAM